ncbi:class D sortase [Peribacillus sp. B-H-3]|uniref:class D sortase n=1 Tax=Peribacillus sp. B-H-3 TaxID=3400420 RepID=UPI003B022A10
MKQTGLIILVLGILCLCFSLYKMNMQHKEQKQSMAQAKSMIAQQHKQQTDIKPAAKPHAKNGEVIGILKIPVLKKELPIVEGADEDDLEKGVGHVSSTSLPGEHRQIVLAGHRDTVFRRLGTLRKSDELTVLLNNKRYTYIIYRTYIVDKDDTTVIRSTDPEEILTLSTCYPFSYVGHAPKRYVIEAKPK